MASICGRRGGGGVLVGMQAVAQDSDRSATGEFLNGDYSTASAMRTVYGSYDTDTKPV